MKLATKTWKNDNIKWHDIKYSQGYNLEDRGAPVESTIAEVLCAFTNTGKYS